jgi:hypothetical protein
MSSGARRIRRRDAEPLQLRDHELEVRPRLLLLVGLAQELSERLELPVEVLDPFRNIKVDSKKFDPDYLGEIVPEMAVAVGLAVRGV